MNGTTWSTVDANTIMLDYMGVKYTPTLQNGKPTLDYYGMLLASGVTILLGTQVILNIAVVSASFFPTGVVLPFITLGGNATLIFLSLMGILFNISKQID